jgi:putative acyl-CoA dehydrogenase
MQGVERYSAEWGSDRLSRLGTAVGSSEWQRKSRNANNHSPKLKTFDRFGHRQDAVTFQDDYHAIMDLGLSEGAASFAWQENNRRKEGAHVIRGGLMYLMYMLNPGCCCPITMTFAAVPALEAGMQAEPSFPAAFFSELHEKLRKPGYDGTNGPIESKPSVTMGMSMTEKQGGSDVRANTTTATLVDVTTNQYSLSGHKWCVLALSFFCFLFSYIHIYKA